MGFWYQMVTSRSEGYPLACVDRGKHDHSGTSSENDFRFGAKGVLRLFRRSGVLGGECGGVGGDNACTKLQSGFTH